MRPEIVGYPGRVGSCCKFKNEEDADSLACGIISALVIGHCIIPKSVEKDVELGSSPGVRMIENNVGEAAVITEK